MRACLDEDGAVVAGGVEHARLADMRCGIERKMRANRAKERRKRTALGALVAAVNVLHARCANVGAQLADDRLAKDIDDARWRCALLQLLGDRRVGGLGRGFYRSLLEGAGGAVAAQRVELFDDGAAQRLRVAQLPIVSRDRKRKKK